MPVVVDANVLVAARLERDEDHGRGLRLANAFERGDLPTAYVPSDVLRTSQRIFTADHGMRLRDHRHVPARGRPEASDLEVCVMSSTARDIRLTRKEGSDYWVARDERTGVASQGKTREEALENLDEAIALHESDDDAIDTPAEERVVLEELGIDPDEVEAAREENDELPEFMQ